MGKVTLACVLLLACVVAEISCIPLIRDILPHYAGCNHLFYPGLKCQAGSQYNYNYCGCHKSIVSHVKVVAGKGLCISRADPSHNQFYLLLNNGITTRMRCAPGTVYSAGICGCTHPPKDPEPRAPKPVAKPEKPAKCLSRADSNGANAFFVNVHGVNTQMFCAPGTGYSQADCSCTIHTAQPYGRAASASANSAVSSSSDDDDDDDAATAVAAAAAAAAAAAVASAIAPAVATAPKENVHPALAAAVAETGPLCHNLPDPTDHRAYFVFEHGKEKRMVCAPGSLYSPVTCACGISLLSGTAHNVHATHPAYHYPHNWLGYHGSHSAYHYPNNWLGYHGAHSAYHGDHGYHSAYHGYHGVHGDHGYHGVHGYQDLHGYPGYYDCI